MADTTIQKQGEVFISQSEYDALRLAGNLQSNTKYHITKTPKTGVDSLEQMNLLNGDKTVTYTTTDGMTVNGKATLTYDGGTTKDVPMKIDLPIVRGDGIDIHKVDGQEKIAVELIPEEVTYMVLGTSEIPQILALSSTGVEYYEFGQLIPYGIAEYTTDNKLMAMTDNEEISDPNTDTVLVNKAYANQHYLAKQEGIVGQTRVYTVRRDMNESYQDTAYVDENYTEWSVALRALGGVLRVGTPVGVNDATTKAYVDGLHHYTHIISLVGSSNTIYITIAAKGYPNPITEIDDAGSTPSLSDLLLASGQSAKAMATGLVTDLDGSKGTVVALWSDNGSVMVEYIVNGTLSSNSVLALGTYTITDIVA